MKNVLFISLMTCILIGQSAIAQHYAVIFPVGNNKIQGTLDLMHTETCYLGTLKLQLPTPLNISLAQQSKTDTVIHFSTSSPAHACQVTVYPADSVRGTLLLGGNRSFTFTGHKAGSVDGNQMQEQFSRLPLIEAENSGVAFPTLSPDGKLLVFSSYVHDFSKQKLAYRTLKRGRWSAPKELPFSGGFSDRSPMFDPKGDYLYFGSTRPVGENEKKDYDLWRVRYENGQWGTPEWLEIINSEAHDYQPSITAEGIYFSSEREGGFGGQDIYFAPLENETFGVPINLGVHVNSKHGEMSVFVGASEDFMIIASGSPDRAIFGNDDLIYFKKEKGQWKYVSTLEGKINTLVNEYGVYVSPDNHWLYYTSDILPEAKIYRIRLKDVLSLK